MNYADSARIQAVLLNCWFSYTPNIDDADIVIFDTCSIKQKAEDKITGMLKNIKPHQKVRLTWCMIQHNLKNEKNKKLGNFLWSLKTGTEIPINEAFNPLFSILAKKKKRIELFFRIDDTGLLPLILPKLGYKITCDPEMIYEYEKILPQGINTSMNSHHTTTAYIPISTWCNQFCSYCIVPFARGLERNFPIKQIVTEAKMHLQQGAKEIVLLGQIVNKHPDFLQILKKILQLKWLQRLRYTSPYPTFFSKELLHLHQTQKKLCPHIHIPFQSGSDKILKQMHRGYTLAQAKKCIDAIRWLSREISITTDIIVWFPGETEKDFKQTLDLVKYGKFDMIYIGIYSARPWTLASKSMPDTIPYTTKHARWDKLNELLKKISTANNKKEIWSTHTVVINSTTQHLNSWYTENMKQVLIKSKTPLKPGSFVTAKITKGIPFKLYWDAIPH